MAATVTRCAAGWYKEVGKNEKYRSEKYPACCWRDAWCLQVRVRCSFLFGGLALLLHSSRLVLVRKSTKRDLRVDEINEHRNPFDVFPR